MEHNGPPRNQLTGSLPPPDNGAPQQGSGRRVTLDSVRDLELFQYTQVKMRELLPDGVPPPYYTRTDLKPRLISAMKERVPTMPDDEATSLVERFMNFRFVTHIDFRRGKPPLEKLAAEGGLAVRSATFLKNFARRSDFFRTKN